MREGNIKERARLLARAGSIINELMLSVDRERGGELSTNLVELYDYVQRLIQDANFHQKDAPLEEAERLLRTLLEGWEGCGTPVALDQAALAVTG